jgi:hypothetical protein
MWLLLLDVPTKFVFQRRVEDKQLVSCLTNASQEMRRHTETKVFGTFFASACCRMPCLFTRSELEANSLSRYPLLLLVLSL